MLRRTTLAVPWAAMPADPVVGTLRSAGQAALACAATLYEVP